MAKKDEQPGDFIDVVDTEGNTTKVTLRSFERLWKDRGLKRVSKTAQDTSKSS